MRLANARDIQRRADFDALADDLAIVFALVAHFAELDFAVNRLRRRIITEAVDRVFAGVEASFAELRFFFLILAALLELEAAARHVGVKAFVRFHFRFPSLCVTLSLKGGDPCV